MISYKLVSKLCLSAGVSLTLLKHKITKLAILKKYQTIKISTSIIIKFNKVSEFNNSLQKKKNS